MPWVVIPVVVLVACAVAFGVGLLVLANLLGPRRPGRVKAAPYESGMDPVHDTRRRFDVRFYLVAIAFLVFDVELLFLYPWAVAAGPQTAESMAVAEAAHPGIAAAVAQGVRAGYVPSRHVVFAGVMVFVALLTLGYVYDWRRGVFRWR